MNGILRPKCVLFRQKKLKEICGAVSIRSGDLIDLVIPGFDEIEWMADKEKDDDLTIGNRLLQALAQC